MKSRTRNTKLKKDGQTSQIGVDLESQLFRKRRQRDKKFQTHLDKLVPMETQGACWMQGGKTLTNQEEGGREEERKILNHHQYGPYQTFKGQTTPIV